MVPPVDVDSLDVFLRRSKDEMSNYHTVYLVFYLYVTVGKFTEFLLF